MALSETQRRRNKVAILTRHHPGSRELAEARRELAAAKLENFVKKAVDAAPPLTDEQRERIAALLSSSTVSGGPSSAA